MFLFSIGGPEILIMLLSLAFFLGLIWILSSFFKGTRRQSNGTPTLCLLTKAYTRSEPRKPLAA